MRRRPGLSAQSAAAPRKSSKVIPDDPVEHTRFRMTGSIALALCTAHMLRRTGGEARANACRKQIQRGETLPTLAGEEASELARQPAGGSVRRRGPPRLNRGCRR